MKRSEYSFPHPNEAYFAHAIPDNQHMPDPDRLLKTISRAADFTRQTPGRRGRFIQLTDADDVLVAGDMHGHIPHFQHVYKMADLAKNPRRHLVLQELVHGKYRYPRGGDKSHQLVDLFCALKNQFPSRVHFLLGNHEMAQWTDRPIIKADEDLNALFTEGIDEAYHGRGAEIYSAYKRSVSPRCPLAIRAPNRVFLSHSLPTALRGEGFSLELLEKEEPDARRSRGERRQSTHCLWGRDTSQANADAFLRKVDSDWLISGHIPAEQGFSTPNERQIIVDCCASPAAYVLFPANRPLTREELLACVHII
jgi:hypothetical protein